MSNKLRKLTIIILATALLAVTLLYASLPASRVEEILITNNSDSGASIVWISSEPVYGSVILKSGENEIEFHDDREVNESTDGYSYDQSKATKRFIHHVTVRNLVPESEYDFQILHNGSEVDSEINHFKTAATFESVTTPDGLYGRAFAEDKASLENGVVIVRMATSVFNSNPISTPLATGTFALDTSSLRGEDLNKFPIESTSTEFIWYFAEKDGKLIRAETSADPEDDQPIADIFISGDNDLRLDNKYTKDGSANLNQSIVNEASASPCHGRWEVDCGGGVTHCENRGAHQQGFVGAWGFDNARGQWEKEACAVTTSTNNCSEPDDSSLCGYDRNTGAPISNPPSGGSSGAPPAMPEGATRASCSSHPALCESGDKKAGAACITGKSNPKDGGCDGDAGSLKCWHGVNQNPPAGYLGECVNPSVGGGSGGNSVKDCPDGVFENGCTVQLGGECKVKGEFSDCVSGLACIKNRRENKDICMNQITAESQCNEIFPGGCSVAEGDKCEYKNIGTGGANIAISNCENGFDCKKVSGKGNICVPNGTTITSSSSLTAPVTVTPAATAATEATSSEGGGTPAVGVDLCTSDPNYSNRMSTTINQGGVHYTVCTETPMLNPQSNSQTCFMNYTYGNQISTATDKCPNGPESCTPKIENNEVVLDCPEATSTTTSADCHLGQYSRESEIKAACGNDIDTCRLNYVNETGEIKNCSMINEVINVSQERCYYLDNVVYNCCKNTEKIENGECVDDSEIGAYLSTSLISPAYAQSTEDPKSQIQVGEYEVVGENITTKSLVVTEAGPVKFFSDLNGDGKKQDDEPYIEDVENIQFELKKQNDVIKYNLAVGWNLISIPMVMQNETSSKIVKASDLIRELNAQGAEVVKVTAYRSGQFVVFSSRKGNDGSDITFGSDFNILPGEGYFIRNFSAVNVILKGTKPIGSLHINFASGWNLVGLYNEDMTGITGFGTLHNMQANGLNANIISKWDGGNYSNVVLENNVEFGNDFSIFETAGYWVQSKSDEVKVFGI